MGETWAPLSTSVASLTDSPLRRGRLVAALLRRLILLGAMLGVVAMHQLAGLPGGHAHEHGTPPAHAVLAASDHCPHPAGSHCPYRAHGHPGQVCQPHQGTGGPDGVPVLAPLPTTPTEPRLLTARTAAHEAGEGTGCGPPRLAELSLRRV